MTARSRSRRRPVALALVSAATVLLVSACAGVTGEDTVSVPAATASATVARPFSSTSPFNVGIKSKPTVDAKSSAMVSALTKKTPVANLVDYGVPVYYATPTTPRVTVTCYAPSDWGTCPLSGVKVPMSSSYVPNNGSDGALVVVDRAANRSYEFWRAWNTSTGWTTEWAGIVGLTGSGWTGKATATGASRLGGVIMLSELENGVIPHALAVQSSMACKTVYRSPATKTDGTSTSSSCIPEGSRIKISSAVDLSKLKMTKAERAIATALQKYGAYVMDRGGATLSVSFQHADDASGTYAGARYSALGLGTDYMALSGIPWSSLRVLAGTNTK